MPTKKSEPADGKAPAAAEKATAGAGDEPSPKPGPKDAADPLHDMVRRARDRYDTQTTWTVTALAAVAGTVYASLPFTNAVGADLFDGFPICIASGLLLAAVGIGIVIWGRSRALEPQDASLGELLVTMRTVEATLRERRAVLDRRYWLPPSSPAPGTAEPLPGRVLRPREQADLEIYVVLYGEEATAHVGPGIGGGTPAGRVQALIARIGELECEALQDARAAEDQDARRAVIKTALVDLTAAVSARPAGAPSMSPWAQQHESLVDGLDITREDLTARGRLAAHRAELAVLLEHRDLLLAESALAQVKGAFRAGRRFLLLGGVLTLVGAAIYTSSLPPDLPEGATTLAVGTPLRVRINPATTGFAPECRDVRALLLSTDQTPRASLEGPVSVFVTSPPCARRLDLAKGEAVVEPG